MVPFRDSTILQKLRDQGGLDVASILELPQYSGQYIPVLCHKFHNIKCFNKDYLFHVCTISTLSSFQELLILQFRVRWTVQEI